MIKIAIVGGGPAGVAAAVNIYSAAIEYGTEISITIFEQGRHFYGRTFDTADKALILNTSVGVSSIVAGEPDHLYSYLRSNLNRDINREEFISRSLAGNYLRDTLLKLSLQIGCMPTQLIHQEVTDVVESAPGKVVVCTSTGNFNFDNVILATGVPFRNLQQVLPVKTVSAYPGHDLRYIEPASAVAIAGTSLSAIDSAVSLIRAGHTGPIAMMSRSGRLPAVRRSLLHDPAQEFENEFNALRTSSEDSLSVDDVVRLLCLLGGSTFRQSLLMQKELDPKTEFFDSYEESLSGYTEWEVHMMAMVDALNFLWPNTSENRRRLFHRLVGGRLNRFISSIPLQNAKIIRDALQSGQLSVCRGSVSCSREASTLMQSSVGIHPDIIVSALGCAPARTDSLIARLAHQGLLKLNSEGGVQVSLDTSAVNSNTRVFALGPATHGQIYTPNFLYSSVNSARKLRCLFHNTKQSHVLNAA